MTRHDPPISSRSLRILERLTGSKELPGDLVVDANLESSVANDRLSDRLKQIEQLFLLHGGERESGSALAARPVLFSWGHLDVLDRIGEGSFGEVFRAYDSILDRDVALKLLRADQERPFQSQLFLHEARQLALVRHPNVLAVHGAAIHDSRPGLWCDLIEGQTLADLANQPDDFKQDEWLDLIESLCAGLSAVHDAGLLHGDVKPSNIMSDNNGQWVLMDFGASLERKPGKDGPAMTSGTPLYMAPEVILGRSPSTSSDIYALGATLYRTIAGRPALAVEDWESLTKLHRSGVTIDWDALYQAATRPIGGLVRAMLAREASERPNLGELLAEIERIRTAPQRRFRRFAVGAVTGSLLLGLVFTSWGLIQANQSRLAAEQEQRNTAAVNQFLQRLLSSPDESGQARDMTVEQMLDVAASDVQGQLTGQYEAQAAVHLALAESYQALNLADEAIAQARFGLGKLETIEPVNASIRPGLELEIIAALEIRGDLEASIARAEEFEARFRDQLPPDGDWLLVARKHRVTCLLQLNRLDEAERLLDDLVERVPDPETATNNLGFTILSAQSNLHRQRGRFAQASEFARAALDWLDRHPRQRLNNRATALDHLAVALGNLNRQREALEVMEQLSELYLNLYGPGSTDRFRIINNMSGFYYALGDLDAAQAAQSEAFALIESFPDQISVRDQFSLRGNYINLLNAQQRYEEGEAEMRELMNEIKARFDERYEYYLLLSYNLTELLNIRQRFDEALAQAERTTVLMREVLGESHPFVWLSESNRAQSLAGLGRAEEALVLHDTASRAVIDAMGFDHTYSLTVRRQAMESRERLAPGSVPEADIRALIETYITQTSAEHPETRKAQALLEGLN